MTESAKSWKWMAAAAIVVAGFTFAWFAMSGPRLPSSLPGASVASGEDARVAPTKQGASASTASFPDVVAGPAAVQQWVADATSGSAKHRATALQSLASAPREQALPVLKRALTDGEPTIDRRLALQSLRELALEQGDADGKIRDAVRGAMYHGDDVSSPEALQETLEVIEESEMHRAEPGR